MCVATWLLFGRKQSQVQTHKARNLRYPAANACLDVSRSPRIHCTRCLKKQPAALSRRNKPANCALSQGHTDKNQQRRVPAEESSCLELGRQVLDCAKRSSRTTWYPLLAKSAKPGPEYWAHATLQTHYNGGVSISNLRHLLANYSCLAEYHFGPECYKSRLGATTFTWQTGRCTSEL